MRRILICMVVVWVPATTNDPDVERLYRAIPPQGCATIIAPIDHAGMLEALQHAYAWNRLLDKHVAAVNHDYFTPQQVLAMIEGWTPQIVCVAREFEIPPELLAGVLALELDLDYHLTDAVFDILVVSPLSDTFDKVEVGAAYGGVHFKHLKPALASFGVDFSQSLFYQTYYRLTSTRNADELTVIATRYRLVDLANAAVMARYYALLRMGNRPLTQMSLTDMAFTWSAYRGGVVGATADLRTAPNDDHRWGLSYLQKADNPLVFGDTLIAMPYFSYFRQLYSPAHLRTHA
ncbi:MAG: hypothetical protein ABI947_07230 [Chloroflexota bacterium]